MSNLKIKPNTIRKIKNEIRKGTRSIRKFCTITRLRPSGFRSFCRLKNIELPKDIIPWRYKPRIDNLIDQGLKLREIKDSLKIKHGEDYTKAHIHMYILESGQEKYWTLKKEKRFELLKERYEIEKIKYETALKVLFLYGFATAIASKETIAERKVLEYRFKKGYNYYEDKNLLIIFERYFNALNKDRKLSLEELSKGTNISGTPVSTILDTVNLEPMYGHRERVVVPKSIREALGRASILNLSATDISYFLNTEIHNARAYLKLNNPNRKSKDFIKRFPKQNLTYRLASQIYQEQDNGKSKEEILEKLKIKEELYEHTIKREKFIKNKIINSLRIMYKNKTINKPYLN